MARMFRFRLVLAILLTFGLVAAACGDDSSTTAVANSSTTESPEPAKMDTVSFQLDWVPNTNHTGFYVADEKGWYAEEGLKLDILPYSGGNGDTLAAEGAADFAVSFQNSITLARPAGVPITAVAAIVQHTVEAIGVRADRNDIQSPADLDGKLYAGFGGPFEIPLMKLVIQKAGGTGEFESVVLDTAAYEAVYNGTADFVVPFKTWEGIEAELTGEPMKYFDYSDYGLPDQYSVIIVSGDDWLADNGDIAERFLRATKRGFEWSAANPKEAAQILIDANPGVFNDPELVFQSQELMAKEFLLDENGNWGTIDPARFGKYSDVLYNAGIVVDGDGNKLAVEPNWNEFINTGLLG